jgi:hypothetical protein
MMLEEEGLITAVIVVFVMALIVASQCFTELAF